MNLLLDTHILLWAAANDRMMSDRADALLQDPDNTLWFSAASIWEIAIKRALNRPDFQTEPDIMRAGLLSNGYIELPINSQHAMAVRRLPAHHADPFDRILIAQAQAEGMRLVTSDAAMRKYGSWIDQV